MLTKNFVWFSSFVLLTGSHFGCAEEDVELVVAGRPINIENFPYQLRLIFYDQLCGGSIISQYSALSAAHCTFGLTEGVLSVRAGSSFRDRGGEVVPVSIIFNHPRYVPSTFDFDVSVLRLARPLTLGAAVPLVAMNENVPPGTQVFISGWGALYEGGPLPDTLQGAIVQIVNQPSCTATYGSRLNDRMICAGGQNGRDTCQGDSGGPLVAIEGGKQVGITSFGDGCARPNVPGVYVRISHPGVRQFIRIYGLV